MKRYKLLKDLPTFKAGEIFFISDAGNLFRERDTIAAYSWSTLDKFPNILTDWFEEIKEPTRWKPERYQKYHCVGSDGRIYDDAWDDSLSVTDSERFDIGNCFQTREEAERVAEYLKSLAVVRGDATSKFAKGDRNWYVYYGTDMNSLRPWFNIHDIRNGIFGLPYFATKEDAQRSIELHKNEWLTIFGVKEEK